MTCDCGCGRKSWHRVDALSLVQMGIVFNFYDFYYTTAYLQLLRKILIPKHEEKTTDLEMGFYKYQ